MSSGFNNNGHNALQIPFKVLVEEANAAVFVVQGTQLLYVNPAMEFMSGKSQGELFGSEFWSVIHPDEQSLIRERYQARLNGAEVPDNYLVRIVHRDGSVYHACHTATLIDVKGKPAVLGVLQDITRLESRRLRIGQQYRQTQKMEAIGTLIGGIAHDFNNILAGIAGSSYLARLHVVGEEKAIDMLEVIDRLCFRGADMIRHLLTFARKGIVKMQPVDVHSLISEMMARKRMETPPHIAFVVDADSTHGVQVMGDSAQLQEVLLALINNACDAVGEVTSPEVRVSATPFVADEAFLHSHVHLDGHEFVRISVQDNGCGMDEEVASRIFEPFFSTKGVGSGLGLPMVYGSVYMQGGAIDVESTPGQGSSFHVFLPVCDSERTAQEAVQDETLVRGHGECILFIDDEPSLLNVGSEVLGSLGYEVLTASDGRSAVDIFRQHADDIDLVVIDVVMPVQDGWLTAEEMLALRPSLRLMFVTGFDMAETMHGLEYVQAGDVLFKPYSVSVLSQAIRRKLDG